MAILMRSEIHGVTAEQAQQIGRFAAGLTDEMRAFPGFVCQAAGPLPDGFQVTEVWESQEAHERWVREVVAPRAARDLGITQELGVTYWSLDRFVAR